MAALSWLMGSPLHITSFLSFELVLNRGISWGMFHSTNNAVFVIVSLCIAIIVGVLCCLAYRNYQYGRCILPEVCIIAGAISNLVDRIMYAGVIDFVLLSYGNLSWPVFNVADVVIVFGVGLLLLRYEK